MSLSQRSMRKSSPLNPNPSTTPKGGPLQAISANKSAQRAPAALGTPGNLETGRTPTGPVSIRQRMRYTPGRAPTTPHGKRAFEQRRAGKQTPARGRRRSAKLARNTPRDILRLLSRALPHPKSAEKENLAPHEEEEESEDDLSSPRLSFGFDKDDAPTQSQARSARQSIEKGRRALFEANRLSMDATMLGRDIDDSDVDDNDAPTTKLLDEEISDDEISMPTPTFGDRDQMGDTLALGQLIAGARSPGTPGNGHSPGTPTGDMSFALDIPDFPTQQTQSPRVQIYSDDIDVNGGFDLPQPEQDELTADPRELALASMVSKHAPLELGAIRHPLLDVSNLINNSTRARGGKSGKPRGPPRDGLPKGVVKRVATSFLRDASGKKGRLKKGALDAILTASDWFFEQVSEDLSAYAEHAGRKTIDDSDALMLVRRQRLLSQKSTLFSLASKHLPAELLKDVKNVQRSESGA